MKVSRHPYKRLQADEQVLFYKIDYQWYVPLLLDISFKIQPSVTTFKDIPALLAGEEIHAGLLCQEKQSVNKASMIVPGVNLGVNSQFTRLTFFWELALIHRGEPQTPPFYLNQG